MHPHQVLDPNRAPARTSPQTPKTNPRMLSHLLVLRGVTVELLVEDVDHESPLACRRGSGGVSVGSVTIPRRT